MEQNEPKINETIVTGRKFRRLDNNETKNWDRICLTTFESSEDFQERIKNIHLKPYKRKEK